MKDFFFRIPAGTSITLRLSDVISPHILEEDMLIKVGCTSSLHEAQQYVRTLFVIKNNNIKPLDPAVYATLKRARGSIGEKTNTL